MCGYCSSSIFSCLKYVEINNNSMCDISWFHSFNLCVEMIISFEKDRIIKCFICHFQSRFMFAELNQLQMEKNETGKNTLTINVFLLLWLRRRRRWRRRRRNDYSIQLNTLSMDDLTFRFLHFVFSELNFDIVTSRQCIAHFLHCTNNKLTAKKFL